MSEKKDEEKKKGSFIENDIPGYESNYSDMVKQSLSDILGRKDYSYNAENDEIYAKYKTMYTDNGKRAMQDTMGNAALLTGGYGNTYGTVAGQQAYNSYMQKLSEVSSDLEQKAYDRYRDEENSAYERLNILLGLDNTDYDRYRDGVSDYKDNRQYQYQLAKDKRAQSNLEYERDRKAFENDRDYEFALAQHQYKKEQDKQAQSNLEYERDRDAYESDRKYNLDSIKLNASLGQAVEGEQESVTDDKFNPEDAYKFIEKHNDKIYTDEELAETLYQLYGEKKGFFDWLETLEVPGNTDGETYLEVLYYLHPELQIPYEATFEDWEKGAVMGGAVPPASARDKIKRKD